MKCVRLSGPTDIDGFRAEARSLIQQGVHPHDVEWLDSDEAPLLWTLQSASSTSSPFKTEATFKVPASYIELCNSVLLHRDPMRFALMYALLWRLKNQPGFWQDRLNADRNRAEQLAREVRRDIHKMRAFVRFTPVSTEHGLRHMAWFEPGHHIVETNAPFFARRFTQMQWAILTPDKSVEWDGQQLSFGPGANRQDAPPPDAGAALWLTYYQHIFNPARLKVDMMVKEMPRRYWGNLPEAALIEPLVATAMAKTHAMVNAKPTLPRRIKPMKAS